jgi:hypothetical protein
MYGGWREAYASDALGQILGIGPKGLEHPTAHHCSDCVEGVRELTLLQMILAELSKKGWHFQQQKYSKGYIISG